MKAFGWGTYEDVRKKGLTIDWVFLTFLILLLNIHLSIKLVAIVAMYFVRPDFNFGFKKKRLPLFYVFIAMLSVVPLVLRGNYSASYLFLFANSILIWLFAFLALHQLVLCIERSGTEKIENSLRIFFVINTVISLANLLYILFETHGVNPYTYDGLSLKYNSSTGDYIRGIFFDVSTTNMIVNMFGVFYFLQKKNYLYSAMCLSVMLLTTSNVGNIILIVFLFIFFVAYNNSLQRSVIVCYLSIVSLFMIKVSGSNLEYFKSVFKKQAEPVENPVRQTALPLKRLNSDSLLREYVNRITQKNIRDSGNFLSKRLNVIEIKKKISVVHADPLKNDTIFNNYWSDNHHKMIHFSKQLYGDSLTAADIIGMRGESYPGKLAAFAQTFAYVKNQPVRAVFGAGPGNFSSKLAFKALGLHTYGSWPEGFRYMNEDFRDNHLKLWVYFMIQPTAKHSLVNLPNSAFSQILGEYGLAGVLLFCIYYLWFYLRRYKDLSYGLLLLPLLCVFLVTDYWFENLSVVVFFETLMFIDLLKSRNAA